MGSFPGVSHEDRAKAWYEAYLRGDASYEEYVRQVERLGGNIFGDIARIGAPIVLGLATGGIGAAAGGASSSAGGAGAPAGGGGASVAGGMPWWGNLAIQAGGAYFADRSLNRATGSERDLRTLATAPYESSVMQGFLPPELRGIDLRPGIAQILDLMARPGGLSPAVLEAILPRLAAESESIATNFRGIRSNQAGAAARGNLPISIKTALGSALDVAQERAQRSARREALADSDALRREDIGQTYRLLDTILQYQSSGRGQAIPGLQSTAGAEQNRQASRLAAVSDLFKSFAGSNFGRTTVPSGGGGGIGTPIGGGQIGV